jgi:hypothetical protein
VPATFGDGSGESVMKSDINQLDLSLRQAISEAKSDLLKWTFGAVGFQIAVIVGFLLALLHGMHP